MLDVAVCEHYGWTWAELQETPQPFLELCIEKMSIDAQEQAKASKGKH